VKDWKGDGDLLNFLDLKHFGPWISPKARIILICMEHP
jgi:hypothetical protein